ncbi:MAG: 1-deoxy-D-xylulose-5-phosphate reductoisomerase [Betaproteobacteria bacterium RIFCSPLOWO2_12_FULL_62_58]|nr:MAG: 1-deoxy-D-xylulose-5-phosphate reductoisomerase [Betaproteobacteria bacterium RIFCSPLOWO2_02_FULL_62_79]OGA48488.1 MAG: 1-deoxy-D-xylulose-5-phosphate reductoisomerase [Betaproteobacteria bacterium RIFCSPLOWO2_12_FULL_62_58]
MPDKQNLTILGSTGSVGVNTLDVIARHPGKFKVVALTARNQVDLLFEQCRRFQPGLAVMVELPAAAELERRIKHSGLECTVLCGVEALEQAASLPQVDAVMAAIVGIAGLRPTLAAARAGKKVLLANKEALVTAGPILMEAVRASGAALLPIDSEHNAIFQALPRGYSGKLGAVGVRRVLLTASGGPFRATPLHRLEHVTPDQACAHPNWVMGRKISVDSATMMNKGLEVIEAHWFFDATESQIEVVIHPESVIHSLVEYVDGSVIAQLGNPDMRTPIAFALGYPDRIAAGVEFLDLARVGALHFERPDLQRFPCLRLAYAALRAGGSAPTVLNAANEIAVEKFLAGKLNFMRIPVLIEAVLEQLATRPMRDLDDVLNADREARACAERWLKSVHKGHASGTRPQLARS